MPCSDAGTVLHLRADGTPSITSVRASKTGRWRRVSRWSRSSRCRIIAWARVRGPRIVQFGYDLRASVGPASRAASGAAGVVTRGLSADGHSPAVARTLKAGGLCGGGGILGLSGRDGIEMPFTREPLQHFDAAVFKRDAGPGYQVLHGARHEHLAGAGQRCDARPGVHRNAAELVP
jgi:hypothetical protein